VPLSERKAETRSTSDRYQGGLQATERDLGHMGGRFFREARLRNPARALYEKDSVGSLLRF
jgi:hypothetical protein